MSGRNLAVFGRLSVMFAAAGVFIGASTLRALDASSYITSGENGVKMIDLQKAVDDAAAKKESKVVIPAGRFMLSGGWVGLKKLKDFTLEGAGEDKTVLVGSGRGGPIVGVSESSRVTLKDFSLDLDEPPFVQATITSVSPEGKMEFETHAGYRQLTDEVWKSIHRTVQFFDQKTRRLVERHHWFGPQIDRNIFRTDSTHGRLALSPVWAERVKAGDFVVFKSYGRFALSLVNSESCRVEGVTILASSSIGIGARFLTGENYFRYTIKRGPTPAGATEPRLLATNDDGMQYFWSPGAVTFENCDLGFTGDDCVNISLPQVLQVAEIQSPTRYLTTTATEKWAMESMVRMSRPGDIVRAERYGTFEPLGDLKLKAISYEGHKDAVLWLAGENGHSSGQKSMAQVIVEVSEAPSQPLKVGDKLVLRRFLPERFAIRNSRFHDTFARGLLVMASNGVIEGNEIEYTGLSGIELRHEIPGFGGADWVSDVIVRNNKITRTCFDDDITRWPGADAMAALLVCNTPIYRREPLGSYPWAIGHKNIRIIGNTIEDSGVSGILVNGLDGGEISGNVIKNTNYRGGKEAGNPMGLSAAYAITVMNSKNVKVKDNKVSDWGKAEGPVGDLGTYPIPPGQ